MKPGGGFKRLFVVIRSEVGLGFTEMSKVRKFEHDLKVIIICVFSTVWGLRTVWVCYAAEHDGLLFAILPRTLKLLCCCRWFVDRFHFEGWEEEQGKVLFSQFIVVRGRGRDRPGTEAGPE